MKTKSLKAVYALVLLILISCSYYTVKDVPSTNEKISEQVKSFNVSKKYVIIHSGSSTWHLKNMIINDDDQVITGVIEPISARHIYKRPRDEKRVHRYKVEKSDPLNEIHFYLKTAQGMELDQEVAIPLQEIERISVNDRNTGRAVANVVLGTVGAAFAALLVAAALKSSCPFVYIKDGQEYTFIGELYPGIITPNLQNNDFLALPGFKPSNQSYTLKVSNQLKEIQYTDQLQLILVNHATDIEVLMDGQGNFHTFEELNAPQKVTSDGAEISLESAFKKDMDSYAFNSAISSSNSTRNLVFEFEYPRHVDKAKLYLTVKNSVWLDYIYGKFNEQFGSYYNTFQEKQQLVSKEKLHKWIQGQNIPLSIYLKNKNEWQLVDHINSVGPLASRDIAIPIELNDYDEPTLQIKLETGFMFWELDFIGMDYSEDANLIVQSIEPSSAVDQYGTNVTHLLTKADGEYFVQSSIGDEVEVSFQSPEFHDDTTGTTVFLKNRGYYNYIRDYDGYPDRERLEAFRVDGAFTRFSEESYFEFINFGSNEVSHNE